MDYLNIYCPPLGTQVFLGASLEQQATWFNLMVYCAQQENGGLIADASELDDTMWKRVAGVSIRDIQAGCGLWALEPGGLRVTFYPVAQEEEHKAKCAGGKKGGDARARNMAHEAKVKAARRANVSPSSSPITSPLSSATGIASDSPSDSASTEGNGTEREAERNSGALAQIPTEQEFIDAFQTDGIPTPYLQSAFAWFEGNNKWLSEGKLKKFRLLVRAWWRRDAETWEAPSPEKNSAPPGPALTLLQRTEALQAAEEPEEAP